MIPEELRAVLSRFPRLDGSGYPTPLEPLDRLTRQINGPRLWVKRDDGVGPGMGGNKGRKLEFLIADALSLNRSKVVTFGGLQSNHARMTAAMCAAHGLQAHLFFFERRPAELVGNLQLNELLAARMHFIPFGGGSSGSMTIEFTNRLVRIVSMLFTGPGVYFIPVGGHNVIGCLGYVAAALELHEQLATMGLDPGRVTLVTAVGTGGTLAGLLAGFRLLRSPVAIMGVDVGGLWKDFRTSVARLASKLCATLGEPRDFRPGDIPLIEGEYIGPGYGVPTAQCTRAIRTLASTEGILVDPVYTGKALAAFLELARERAGDEQFIFLHTGGVPGLWAYNDQLAALA